MELENLKFGLLLACGALLLVFLFFATYYTLYEISLNKKLKRTGKFKWSAVTLLLPGVGPLSYFLLTEKPWYEAKR